MKNTLISFFLRETFGRLMTKSPNYFRIWQMILGALFLITLIPQDLLMSLPFSSGALQVIRWVTITSGLMLQLTTQSGLTVTDEGSVVKTTDADKLPLTAQDEQKQATK